MNKKFTYIYLLAIIACIIMFGIERYLQPGYFIKSMIKLIAFGSVILLGGILTKGHESFFKKLGIRKIRNLKITLLIGIIAYLGIIIGYLILSDFIDAKQITDNLLTKEHITADNFIFVAIYISIVNSFLEEALFRGTLFLSYKKTKSYQLSFILSALLFALYHIGIMTSWFSPLLFVFMIILLFVAGLVLNVFCYWNDSFLSSWIIHVAANLSINTIGFIMLGVL